MKRLLISLLIGIVAYAPTMAKQTKKIAPEQMSYEQLKQEHKKYKTRGIALLATSPLPLALSVGSGYMSVILFVLSFGVLTRPLCFSIGFGVLSVACLGGGLYMIGQGIHDLAKAKKIHRLQMKEAAQKRRAERKAEQEIIARDIAVS